MPEIHGSYARAALACLLFLLLLSGAAGLEFSLNKNPLFKGETLEIAGTGEGMVSIRAEQAGKLVFATKIPAGEDGGFYFSKAILLTDPKGGWAITVSDSSESRGARLTVNPTRKSEFLLVSFLSPTPTSYYRTSSFSLSVRVTDGGREVRDAAVYVWDFSGEMKRLANNKDGTYSMDIGIPSSAKLGKWELRAVATAESGGEAIGGENSITLNIEASPLHIEMLSPRSDEYGVGADLPIELKLTYPDGSPAGSATVYATVNYEPVELEHLGGGVYSGTFYPKTVKNEVLTISIRAADRAGNSGSMLLALKPADYFWWLLKENAIFYIFPLLFVAYIFYLSAKELLSFASRSRLEGRKQDLLALKKRLHNDFYRRGIISRRNFERRNAEYNAELNRADSGLRQFREY